MRHHNLILTLQHECQCPEFTANPARNVMVNHSCNDLLIRNDPFQILWEVRRSFSGCVGGIPNSEI